MIFVFVGSGMVLSVLFHRDLQEMIQLYKRIKKYNELLKRI